MDLLFTIYLTTGCTVQPLLLKYPALLVELLAELPTRLGLSFSVP